MNRLKDIKSRWSDIMNVDDLLAAELSDPRINPEIQWAASLRRSNDLCDQEATLVKERRKRAVKQLHRFLRLPEDEVVDERDVPIVAIGGSGGGFRAVRRLICPLLFQRQLDMLTAWNSADAWTASDVRGSQRGWHVGSGQCLLPTPLLRRSPQLLTDDDTRAPILARSCTREECRGVVGLWEVRNS